MGRSKFHLPVKDIIKMYKGGKTVGEIADYFGCSNQTIYGSLRKSDTVKIVRKEKVLKRAKELMERYNELGTYEKVGLEYGISRQRVHQIINKCLSMIIEEKKECRVKK